VIPNALKQERPRKAPRVSSLSVHAANRKFDPTGIKIIESIHKARDYRQRYTSPTHKINENLKSDVRAAFKL
jgi:hypothetical protein